MGLTPIGGIKVFDQQMIDRFKQLYSSIVSDSVEALGHGPRVMAPGLKPFHENQLEVVVGAAHVATVRKTSERVEIDVLLEMVEASPAGSIVVMAPDADVQGALWGGLMTAAVKTKGAVGAVVDGGIRDLHQVLPLEFPVFAMYRSPLDIRGRAEVVAFDRPAMCRGVMVTPGELIFADANGVVVIPAGAEEEVLARCEERVGREVQTENELKEGKDPTEVYSRLEAF